VSTALLWALDGGLLAMLTVGVPYVLTFYLVLAALEDTGYLTSAAVLMDRLFGFLGLPGRAAIPLLTATGCNVPAVHGTRILRTQRERVLAGWLVTLMPCSARSAILIAAVAPFLGLQAALAAFVLIGGLAILTGIGANAMIPGRQPALVLELAPLRLPIARHVWAKAWFRFRSFVVTATPYMIVGSFVVGLAYASGAWQPIAQALDPVSRSWIGLPAVALVAIAFAFLRKELALQLLIVFSAVELAGAAAGGAGATGSMADLTAVLGPAQLFVFAIVASISIPCVATLATLRAELGGRAAAIISLASMTLAVTVGVGLAHALGIA
jgi:ferrous iron transport protein B